MSRLLLTGAGGFIGHHALEHVLVNTDWDVVATDSFRHKGKWDRIAQVVEPHPQWRKRVQVITHDLAAPFTASAARRMGNVDYMIAMASESHVNRSIADPVTFVRNNIDVILHTLELARILKPQAVIVISTDEVYGPVKAGEMSREWAPIIPSNPYAASKAAQEAIAISYWRTYSMPIQIVNCMNAVGERQDSEKYLPKMTRQILRGETVQVHGTPGDIGTRHYLHARNFADALLFILTELPPVLYPDADRPDRYNVASPEPVSNLELALETASVIGKELKYELTDFHSFRPGHDPHYGLDMAKLTGLGWKPPIEFGEALERTVLWSMAHPEWLE